MEQDALIIGYHFIWANPLPVKLRITMNGLLYITVLLQPAVGMRYCSDIIVFIKNAMATLKGGKSHELIEVSSF